MMAEQSKERISWQGASVGIIRRSSRPIERLWRSVKYEEVYLKAYENGTQAKKGLGDYFEFYNSRRRHQDVNHRTPDEVYHQTLSLPQAA